MSRWSVNGLELDFVLMIITIVVVIIASTLTLFWNCPKNKNKNTTKNTEMQQAQNQVRSTVQPFTSSLLLSSSSISSLGISSSQIENFRRMAYQRAFGISSWTCIPSLAQFSISEKNIIVNIDVQEAKALFTYCKTRIANSSYSSSSFASSFSSSSSASSSSSSSSSSPLLNDSLSSLIDRVQMTANEEFGTRPWFVKLDTRSPKDTVLNDSSHPALRRLLRLYLRSSSSSSPEPDSTLVDDENDNTLPPPLPEPLTVTALNYAFVMAANHSMQCRTAQDALNLLSGSHRIVADLAKALEFVDDASASSNSTSASSTVTSSSSSSFSSSVSPSPPSLCSLFSCSLVLRSWCPSLISSPAHEFRCFVHNRQLTCVTQYFCWMPCPLVSVWRVRVQVMSRIVKFVRQVLSVHAPYDSFVVDLFVPPRPKKEKDEDGDEDQHHDVRIIEFNPFHHAAGAGLFSWQSDRSLFLNGPLEFRLVAPLEVEADGDIGLVNRVMCCGSECTIRGLSASVVRAKYEDDQIPTRWIKYIKSDEAGLLTEKQKQELKNDAAKRLVRDTRT